MKTFYGKLFEKKFIDWNKELIKVINNPDSLFTWYKMINGKVNLLALQR